MANDNIIKGITPEQLKDLERVMMDPIYFSEFCTVVHPIKGKVPFKLYPYQKAVLLEFLNHRFNIIKKFRQGGLTELICLYCLWLASYHINKNILILSIKDRVAKKVLRRIKYMYKNLPEHLKVPVINGRGADVGTSSEMEFSTGSVITSLPTTEDAGRSEPASMVVIDEAAIIRGAGKLWAALFPTLSTGGSGILNSTPYGVGNFYHETWVEAISGSNGFNAINLKYTMHPDYNNPAWYAQMKAILGPRRTAQEVDGDFLSSGNNVFDLLDIRDMEEEQRLYPPLGMRAHSIFNKVKTYGGGLRVYALPKKNEKYFIGADISTGRSSDYTTMSCMNKAGDEFFSFRGKIPIGEAASLMMQMGKIYNRAILAPESNDIGLGVATKIQDEGYPNLYYSRKLLKKKGANKPEQEDIPGWYTTRANRPVMIAGLEEDVRLCGCNIKDPFFVQESYTFIYDEQNRPVAMGKGRGGGEDPDEATYTDDTILCKAITNHVRKGLFKGIAVLPK